MMVVIMVILLAVVVGGSGGGGDSGNACIIDSYQSLFPDVDLTEHSHAMTRDLLSLIDIS